MKTFYTTRESSFWKVLNDIELWEQDLKKIVVQNWRQAIFYFTTAPLACSDIKTMGQDSLRLAWITLN